MDQAVLEPQAPHSKESATRLAPGCRVLYISYDGILEPLGESQVLAYLERLAAGFFITLISFEKAPDWADKGRVQRIQSRMQRCGIHWEPLRYHKNPPLLSTAWDVWAAFRRGKRWLSSGGDIIHARGYAPSLMALLIRGGSNARFIFDMRGFWADERAEIGQWPQGSWMYRLIKAWERRFFAQADAIVSLTRAAADYFPKLGYAMKPDAVVSVIPTCADLSRFHPKPKNKSLAAQLGIADSPVIGTVGTLSNWYMKGAMLSCLARIARELPQLKVLLVTRDDHARLWRDIDDAGLSRRQAVVVVAPFEAVDDYIRLMDAGLFFIRPSFAKKASAATKLGEFLGCGVPVIINAGVGDSGDLVRATQAGVVLDSLDDEAYAWASQAIQALWRDGQASLRCRQAAEKHFDLDGGAESYARLYSKIMEKAR